MARCCTTEDCWSRAVAPGSVARLLGALALAALWAAAFLLLRGAVASGAANEPADVSAMAAPPAQRFLAGEVLVKFRPGVAGSQAQAVLREQGLQQVDAIPAIGVRRVRVPAGREEEMAARLSRNPDVLYAVPNGVIGLADTSPNDPYYAGYQWNLSKVLAPAAWDVVTGSAAITIAVIDTGIDGTHPDLVEKMVPGFYQYTENGIVYSGTIPVGTNSDGYGHGTHVAGIAAASTNNGIGVAGMSWGARLMPFRSQASNGNGSDYDVAYGLVWVTDHGAQVINISLGGTDYVQALADAVAYAWQHGVVVVAAAGNYAASGNPVVYPAAYTHTLAVAATDTSDQHPYFSSYGYYVDVGAPGAYTICSTLRGGGYGSMYGTSMASPLVAGLAALVWSANPALTNAQVTRIITGTADKVGPYAYTDGWNEYYGYGRANAAAAVNLAFPIRLTGPQTALIGEPITYVLSVGNSELVGYSGVTITDALPAGAWFVSASDGGVFADGVISWTVGSLSPLTSISRTLVVTASQSITNSEYGVKLAQGLAVMGDEAVVTRLPEFAIQKMAPALVRAGEALTYALAIMKGGDHTATGVVITDVLPTGAAFLEASDGGVDVGGVVSWTVPVLLPGQNLVRTFSVMVSDVVTNTDYGVTCLEGASATGAVAVRTSVGRPWSFFPLFLVGWP